jgi:hypothetical protein
VERLKRFECIQKAVKFESWDDVRDVTSRHQLIAEEVNVVCAETGGASGPETSSFAA